MTIPDRSVAMTPNKQLHRTLKQRRFAPLLERR
jgi:hypothetical protein